MHSRLRWQSFKHILGTGLLVLSSLAASAAASEDNWADWRGPSQNGQSVHSGLPVRWSETENVRWKTSIHGRGWSSPVIYGKQVWITTATEDGRQMFAVCLDRDSGQIVFDQKLFDNPEVDPIAGGREGNSYASPSPVIDSERAYFHFGTYGTACVDTRSLKVLWQRRDIHCKHSVGPGSSPVLWRSLLILSMDGIDVQYLTALNAKTGETVWKTERSGIAGGDTSQPERRKAFCTPLIARVNGSDQIVCAASSAFYGYDPATGRELWRVRHPGYSNASRPLLAGDLLYLNTGYDRAELWAVRAGGSGDVTSSHVAWKYARNVPLNPSPVVVGDTLYLLQAAGLMTALDAKSGEERWKERIEGHYSASPLVAEGRIYLFSDEGKTLVLEPGPKLKIASESQLADGFMASPAVSGRALFLRTKTHLYRIEDARATR